MLYIELASPVYTLLASFFNSFKKRVVISFLAESSFPIPNIKKEG